ncbi:hypothetical protein E1A91_A04G026600v1 [Gossypium mustelinum]|uniref:Uncharacterized protein n=1 Tax=Gossypium mustelinum TaxID=34275 RepID=A0A5D2ZMT8_GOSMU|nr:hypothetical protein E1A91_A04G026600v1 [Gossypium mustelinum]
MDSATVHEEIDSLFESTPPLKDSAKIIDKLNQVIQFDSPSVTVPEANRFCTYFPLPDICLYMYTFSYFLGEGKGRRVEELLKRCPNLKKIIIFRVISKAKPHKECQVHSSGSSQSAQFANSWKRIDDIIPTIVLPIMPIIERNVGAMKQPNDGGIQIVFSEWKQFMFLSV